MMFSAARTRDDMNLRFKPDSAHAYGLFDILAINYKLLRLHEQQALVGRKY